MIARRPAEDSRRWTPGPIPCIAPTQDGQTSADRSGGVRPRAPTAGVRMFHVDYDARANHLVLTVKGFWKPEDVTAFAASVGTRAQEARAVRPDFDVLVESLDFPVQANDVADLLTGIMRGGMALTSGRAAVVVGSHLNKAQAERTLVHPRVRVFLTLDDARRWLADRGGAEATPALS